MRASGFATGGTVVVSVAAALVNTWFWLGNAGLRRAGGPAPWVPVAAGSGIYLALAGLAYARRRSPWGSALVLVCTVLAALMLYLGRGRDWYGSLADPKYYDRSIRLGSLVAALGQLACLFAAGGVVLGQALATRLRT